MKSIFTFSLLMFVWASAGAQIFVKQIATGANNGSSWANAFTNLQTAIDIAEPGEEIWVAAGFYVPTGPSPENSHFWMTKPIKIYGGFTGNESTLNERNWESNVTILSGDINMDDTEGVFLLNRSDNAHHIFIIDVGFGESLIDGIIFQGGATRVDLYAPDSTDLHINRWGGGALYIHESTVTVRNVTFRDNLADRGAGLYAAGDYPLSSTLTIENSSFLSNLAYQRGAGAALINWNTCTILNSKFHQNESGSIGGALGIGNGNVAIRGCEFSKNSASVGGACMIFHNSFSVVPNSTVNITKSYFTENTALSSGGAVRFSNFDRGFEFTIDSSTFTKNTATQGYNDGGAVSVVDYPDAYIDEITNIVEINQSEFVENSASFGGGVIIEGQDDSLSIKISKTNFLSNKGISGGGLYVANYGSETILYTGMTETNFLGNSVTGNGGGIFFDSYGNNFRQSYDIHSSRFENNITSYLGGAINSTVYFSDLGAAGNILNSEFRNNEGTVLGGAIYSYGELLLIDQSIFSENYTSGTYSMDLNGGGAMTFDGPEVVVIKNTLFEKNISDNEGAAIFINGNGSVNFENSLFSENDGYSAILNNGNLFLLNSTIVGNITGLSVRDSSSTDIQNTIFQNVVKNMEVFGEASISSKGGNISTDGSMSSVLIGYGQYEDHNNTDPLLNPENVPESGSPAIDAGNPDGVTALYDLAGNPRFVGPGIDIGSYESFTVAVKDAIWNDRGLTVFPNPADKEINIEFQSDITGDIAIIIYNYTGQLVHRSSLIKSSHNQIFQNNVTHLPTGEYVILIVTGNKTYASNVVIQR